MAKRLVRVTPGCWWMHSCDCNSHKPKPSRGNDSTTPPGADGQTISPRLRDHLSAVLRTHSTTFAHRLYEDSMAQDSHPHLISDPFDQIPFELLSTILLTTQNLFTLRDRPKFPVVPLLCCKRWHETVMQTPDMWANIVITGPRSRGRASVYAYRAKHVPLKVLLDTSKAGRQSGDRSLTEFVWGLSSLTPQCQRIEIICPQHQIARAVFNPHFPFRLPMATEFSLRTKPGENPGHSLSLPSPLAAPCITAFTLSGVRVDWQSWKPINLQKLALISCSPTLPGGCLVALLNANPQLRTLHLEDLAVDVLNPQATVVLGLLEDLSLVGFDQSELKMLSEIVSAPNVRHFAIGEKTASTVSKNVIMGFSFRQLEHIVFERMSLSEEDLQACAANFPHLTHVGLGPRYQNITATGENVDPNSFSEEFGRIFPNVRTFTFRGFTLPSLLRCTFYASACNLNLHISDIGLPGGKTKKEIQLHASCLRWLRQRFNIGVIGSEEALEGEALFASWEDLERRKALTMESVTIHEEDLCRRGQL